MGDQCAYKRFAEEKICPQPLKGSILAQYVYFVFILMRVIGANSFIIRVAQCFRIYRSFSCCPRAPPDRHLSYRFVVIMAKEKRKV